MPKLKSIKFIVFICGIFFVFASLSTLAISSEKEANADRMQTQKPTETKKVGVADFELDSILTIVGIVIGAILLVWQMGRQHKNNLKLQKENFRDKLKLEIYQKLGEKISRASDKSSKIGTMARTTVISLDSYLFMLSSGAQPKPVPERVQNFHDCYRLLTDSILSLIYMIEDYEIANKSFRIFNMAIQSCSHDLDKAYMALHVALLKLLPIDVAENQQEKVGTDVIIPKGQTKEAISNLKELSDSFNEKTMDLGCYLYDLQVEAQNTLLGGLFEQRRAARKPTDPRYVVISAKDPLSLDKLEKHFMEETDWGKAWQKAKGKQ